MNDEELDDLDAVDGLEETPEEAEQPASSTGVAPTQAQIERIILLIQSGNDLHVAAETLGIPSDTFDEWMKKGKEGGTGRSIYMELYREVIKARAMAEANLISKIQQAAQKNWNAAAWLLERGFDGWGKKSVMDNKEKPSTPLDETPFADLDNVRPLRRSNSE